VEQEKLRERILQFEESCRRAGLKLTHQRLEIFRELTLSTEHPSAEALYKCLTERMPTLSLDTVYRTLATFNLHGLVHKVETAESQARFEVVHERHHHLICRQCQEIVDFRWPSIDSLSLPEEFGTWGQIDSRNVVVYGICSKCSQEGGIENKAEDDVNEKS
jgi:Fur family peroxide stress response transcriptional regulator